MIQELQAQIKALSERVARLEARASSASTAGPTPDDIDLADPFNDPKVHKDPKFWEGRSYEGVPFSQCPPDYLEALGRSLQGLAAWHDQKNNVDDKGRPKSFYAKRDAARARAWAKANRAKFAEPPAPAVIKAPEPAQWDAGDSDLPF